MKLQNLINLHENWPRIGSKTKYIFFLSVITQKFVKLGNNLKFCHVLHLDSKKFCHQKSGLINSTTNLTEIFWTFSKKSFKFDFLL